MSIEIRVPTLGESIVDATIASWLKNEGDTVQRGDALVELETDKVNVEVNAEEDGVLQKVMKQVGDVVAVGDVIGMMGDGAASLPAQPPEAAEADKKAAQPAGYEANGAAAVAATEEQRQPTAPLREQKSPPRWPATTREDALRPPSPLARRIAAEHNVDISQVQGTSPHGRVTKDDVVSYLEQNTQGLPVLAASNAPAMPAQPAPRIPQPPSNGNGTSAKTEAPVQPMSANQDREERVRMSRRRQTIAQRLVEAQHTAAMLTTFNEVDMSAIMEVRSRRKETFKERHNVSLGFMSFFTKAVVGALKAFPRLNAEIQGDEMILKHYYDIGIAVGAEEGLVVPVLRDADRKGFAQIEREIAELAKRARSNTLSLADLQGGTFTITNGGVFGSLLSTPILNGPQVAILGMHKIEQRPIALDGQVVIRPMMYLALSYDHRIVDGSEAVQFLVRVKELVEDSETLLLEG
jgi:2-oxoglutarate dehydrogenase E2 component (dihydrolipoamide succinyltransferase)